MSFLSEDFHKAVHYGKKILNAREHIALTDRKIAEADRDVALETERWHDLSQGETAYKMYDLMLNDGGSSALKAIVAQCLASILRWKTSIIPDGVTQEKMFDMDLYGFKTDVEKKASLKTELEADPYIGYIVNAIKYAAGGSV